MAVAAAQSLMHAGGSAVVGGAELAGGVRSVTLGADTLAWIARDFDGPIALEYRGDGQAVGGDMHSLAAVIEAGGLRFTGADVDLMAREAWDGGLARHRGILESPRTIGGGWRDEIGDVTW